MPSASSSRLNWLFVDMNSFFASIEQHLRPELRDRPVGVVPMLANGTCIIAASYDAKQRGIKVGTKVTDAKALCPDITLVEARPPRYVEVHHDILQSIDRCAPIDKVYSIDEWSIRLRGKEREPEQATALARAIKAQLLEDFSPWLTCSIGIAPTRLLAKIASDLKKPDGLTVLAIEDMPHKLEHCELNNFAGIGAGMLKRLHAAGVSTVRQLWDLTPEQSRKIWGSVGGESWWLGFHGHDVPEPKTHRRTINQSNMLSPEHRDDAGAHGIVVRLLCKAAFRLRSEKRAAHRLSISVKSYNNARTWSSETPLDAAHDTITIVRAFERLWAQRPWASVSARDGWAPFSQVSMTLSGLDQCPDTPLLFAPEEDERLKRLSAVLDEAEHKWGRNTVYLGGVHGYRHRMDSKIAFGRIPDRTDQEAWAKQRMNQRRGLT